MDNHDYRVDRLRLLACLGVVMLHSSAGTGTGDLILNALFRFSVPVFVIISGWFQLSASPKRMGRKCAILVGRFFLWSAFYLVIRKLIWDIWPEDVLVYLLTEPVHLWYLYAAAALCILTPALIPFVRSADASEYRYALTLCFVIGCVCVTLVRLGWIPVLAVILDKSKLPQMLGFLFLYLLGGYFRRFGMGSRKSWIAVGVLSSIVSALSCTGAYNQQFLSFISPNVVLAGAACFVVCMTARPVAERYQGVLRKASECTMGIYLLHPLASSLITPWLDPLRPSMYSAVYMLLRFSCLFSATFLAVWLLGRIRFVKKYLL